MVKVTRLAVVATITLAMLIGLSAPASAADPPALSLRVSTPVAQPGAGVYASGTGFVAGERVDLYLGTLQVAAVTAGSDGSFSGTRFTVPTNFRPGAVPIVANGRFSLFTAQATFRVGRDWAQAGGGSGHSYSNPDEHALTANTVGGLSQSWGFSGTSDTPPPTVAYGIIFVAQTTGIFAVGENRESRWHIDANLSSLETAAGGGRLYFWTGTSLRAVDALTGTSLWTKTGLVSGRPGSAPTYANGSLFVSLGQDGAGVVRIDATSGRVMWTHPVSTGDRPPTMLEGLLYVRRTDGDIEALDPATGVVRWTRALPGSAGGTLGLSEDALVAPGETGTTVLDAATGAVRWSDARRVEGDAAVAAGRVFVAVRDQAEAPSHTVALDLATGRQLWSDPSRSRTPVAANGLVYVAQGGLLILGAASGQVISRRTFEFESPHAVSVVNGAVYLSSTFSDEAGTVQGYHTLQVSLPSLAAPTVRSVDDRLSQKPEVEITYSSGWVEGSRPGAYGDGFHYAWADGAIMTIRCTCTGFRFWFSSAPNFGLVGVNIDGYIRARIEQYSSVRRDGVKSWTSGPLGPGPHKIVLSKGNEKIVNVDRFDFGTTTPTGAQSR